MPIIAGKDGMRTWVDRPLQVGDVAKVTLPHESPWAEVLETFPDGTWRGRIVNVLVLTEDHGYRLHDVVLFEVQEDADTWVSVPVTHH